MKNTNKDIAIGNWHKRRQERISTLESLDQEDFEGSLKGVQDHLLSLEAKYAGCGYDDIRIEFSETQSYGDAYPVLEIVLIGIKDETDKQYENRIEDEKERQRQIIEIDRKKYEELKKQFGE